ncbi:MAG: asparaginase [Oscillospiraceae bacterium]|nr:asparaginase [Oscillospiraceae bacterium]
MRIALILTGGTICCRTSADGSRRSDANTALSVLEQHYRLANPFSSVEFETQIPLNCLSEDLTPEDWCTLLRAVATTNLSRVDGIIIAHGTDTLEQTAAMLSAALCGIGVPVILVSAIAPLSDSMTNGHANFEAAVKLICKHLEAGVWVVYRNSDGEMYLHRGFDLQACLHDSIDFFSIPMKRMSVVLEAQKGIKKHTRTDMRALAVKALRMPDVMLVRPHNGLRYDRIPLEGVSAIVHGTYHSETANSVRYSPYSVSCLLYRCKKAEIPVYLAPCRMTGQSYGSSADLVSEGAIPLEGFTVPFAYGAVWVSRMLGYEGEALTSRVRQLRQSLESQFFRCSI